MTAKLQCPYCGATANREDTGNGGVIYVSETLDGCEEAFDTEITFWRCSMYPAHIFYADDYNGNCAGS